MALDYSKLSDAELEAIANDDYSKLSDKTLEMISKDNSSTPAPSKEMFAAPPQLSEHIAAQTPYVAGRTAQSLLTGAATENLRDVAAVARNATSWTPNAIMEVVSHPVETAKAYVAGHPWANTPVRQLATGVGRNIVGAIGQGFVAPENLFTLPYNMAAYEQAKIRMNPNAPEYANNPYAMQYRGEAPTQAAAGEMNRQRALQTMSTAGNPAPGTPEFQRMQQQYQPSWIDTAMQNFQRYRGVIGQ